MGSVHGRLPHVTGCLRQAERRFRDERHEHRRQKRSPDFLNQRADVARLVIDAGEVQSVKQFGDACVSQDLCRRLQPPAG